jgi:phospholipase C
VVVCPYAKPGYVSEQDYDHTSVLKLIERKWNLPPLTRRDAGARDPLEMVDFEGPPAFLNPPDLAAPAIQWPSPPVPVSRRVKIAQAIGLVGRTADSSGPP